MLAGLMASAGSLVAAPSSASASGLTQTVIVTGAPIGSLVSDVLNAGGSVLNQLPIISGIEATIPTAVASLLSAVPGLVVTPDLTVSVQADMSAPARQPAAVYPEQTGATTLESDGDSGQGVTVAVLDTGIDNLPDFAGRLIGGVDFTGGNNPYNDAYGHGTFIAGLIAGNGASSNGQYVGEAPGADLVSIKVAGATGQTDLARVIEGVQWAVANEATYRIKVLNMSLGFQPITSTVLNPLDQAVEAAWNAGITVITSAGNAGPFNGTILSPGDDPLVITVGAVDDQGQANPADDAMTDFSSVGPTNPDGWAKPDLVASGRSVVSLAAPGSTIYNDYPSARIGTGNFVGSGTSFSTAITSGAAALVLADNSGLTPNQVKARLLGTATPGPVGNPFVDGHGVLDAYAAATSGNLNLNQSTLGEVATSLGQAVGLNNSGSLSTWNPNLWTGAAWDGAAWDGAAWDGAAWDGAAWDGAAWDGFVWSGAAWDGAAWDGAAWDGAAWDGAAWDGAAWDGAAWDGAAWDGAAWDSSSWS
jgi:serine protease AprX